MKEEEGGGRWGGSRLCRTGKQRYAATFLSGVWCEAMRSRLIYWGVVRREGWGVVVYLFSYL